MKPSAVFAIIVPGEPQGKGRPIVGRFKTKSGREFANLRTPRKTMNYEARIASAWDQTVGVRPLIEGPVELDVLAVFSMPESRASRIRGAINTISRLTKGGADARSDAYRERAETIRVLSEKVSKPDWDNIGKAVCDALNGVAWKDDAQVIDARVRKRYADDEDGDEAPYLRVVVRAYRLD